MTRFRGGLLFKAHRLFNHSTLGSRVIKKKKKKKSRCWFNINFWNSRLRAHFGPPPPRASGRGLPALSGGPNSALQDFRFTLKDSPKRGVYNLRSPYCASKKTFGILNSPKKSSICCWLLLIKILSWWLCGGVAFLKPSNQHILVDEIDQALVCIFPIIVISCPHGGVHPSF